MRKAAREFWYGVIVGSVGVMVGVAIMATTAQPPVIRVQPPLVSVSPTTLDDAAVAKIADAVAARQDSAGMAKAIGKELQRVIDRNEARALPAFGR